MGINVTGAKIIVNALKHPNCKVKWINLMDNNFTERDYDFLKNTEESLKQEGSYIKIIA